MIATSRIPPNSWLTCPDGHRIAKAVDGVTIGTPRNWRGALTDWQDKAGKMAPYACGECGEGGTWIRQNGGRGLVCYEAIAPESSLITP